MTDRLRNAIQSAVDALDRLHGTVTEDGWAINAGDEIDALRAALAEPEAEPVAWGIVANNTGRICHLTRDAEEVADYNPERIVPLYAAPPRREWQSMTDEEKRLFSSWLDEKPDAEVFSAIERALREKNHG